MNMLAYYRIHVAGWLDPCWSEWLGGLDITPLDTGETLLSGRLIDQASLYGVLHRLRDMNLELIDLRKDTEFE
jgi:hypothetical protein